MKLECQKQKDAIPFPSMSFELMTVALDGGQTSCVLVCRGTSDTSSDQPLSSNQKGALMVLAGFGKVGATSGVWGKASGLGETTYHRVRRDLMELGFVEIPGGPGKGSKYKLTKEGQIAVTVK